MVITQLNDKFQITIPKPIRELAKLRVGDRLYCKHSEGLLTLGESISPEENAAFITVRDRFQVTLPVKKLRIRTLFSTPVVVVEGQNGRSFTVHPMPPLDQLSGENLRPTTRAKPPIQARLAKAGRSRWKKKKT